MTNLSCSNNELNLSIYGFSVDIYSNKNIYNGKMEHAVNISPNTEFSEKLIKDDNIHIIFDLDNSGSMSAPLYTKGKFLSRLELCKIAIKQIIEFLHVLVQKGKNIFITLIEFHSTHEVVFECYKLENNKTCIEFIYDKINKIITKDSTNLGGSIDAINKIEISNSDIIDSTYKILLSDGYSNYGYNSDYLKQNYSNYFNACIGIGNESEYDKELLSNLSTENIERNCNTSSEINDQIIDSVFGNINKIANNIDFGKKTKNIANVNSNKQIINNNVIINNITITSSIFSILGNGSTFKITINDVSDKYLYSSGLPEFDNNNIQHYAINHINFGSIDIFYTKTTNNTETPNLIKIELVITYNINSSTTFNNIVLNNNHTSKNNKIFRTIQNFIKVSNEIIDLNEIDITNKETHLSKIVTRLKSLIDCLDNTDNKTNQYISKVVDKFYKTFEPMLNKIQLQSNIVNDVNFLTPARMISSQASFGNYAFLGRQVSMGYSTGNNAFIVDNELSDSYGDDTNESETNSDQVSNQNVLYPDSNIGLTSNIFSLPSPPNNLPPLSSALPDISTFNFSPLSPNSPLS